VATTKDVHAVISQIGVGYNYKGTTMIERAVLHAIQDPESLQLVTKWIYPQVARELDTTPARVERNIRTVIGIAWDENRERFCETLNRNFRRKPTNAVFLSAIADCMYLEIRGRPRKGACRYLYCSARWRRSYLEFTPSFA
jgi:two-component system, response regulator, stage 0 sporulation protein A